MKAPAPQVSRLLSSKNITMWRAAPAAAPTAKPVDDILVPTSLKIEPFCRFAVHDALYSVGSFTYCISSLPGSVSMGRYCSIARGVKVLGTRHPYERVSSSPFTYDKNFIKIHAELQDGPEFTPMPNLGNGKFGITIGHDVWIGEGVTIAGSITIGTGAVVAGNSHLVKDVAPYTIVGGNPAKVIKNRFSSESLIADLLASEWWKYKFFDFSEMSLDNPEEFLVQLRERESAGMMQAYEPDPVTFLNLKNMK